MMSLTFGLFTQVSGSGPLGPLVVIFIGRFAGFGNCKHSIYGQMQGKISYCDRMGYIT